MYVNQANRVKQLDLSVEAAAEFEPREQRVRKYTSSRKRFKLVRSSTEEAGNADLERAKDWLRSADSLWATALRRRFAGPGAAGGRARPEHEAAPRRDRRKGLAKVAPRLLCMCVYPYVKEGAAAARKTAAARVVYVHGFIRLNGDLSVGFAATNHSSIGKVKLRPCCT